MSEVGASALLADAGTPAEPVTPSREQAFQKLNAMQNSHEFRRRLVDGDASAIAELKLVRSVVHGVVGLQVAVRPDSTPESRELVGATWSDFASLPPEVIAQAKNPQPISEEEYRFASEEKHRLFRDQGWVKRYFDGDRDARTRMATISIILSSPIKA
jgi:hypothetical protein